MINRVESTRVRTEDPLSRQGRRERRARLKIRKNKKDDTQRQAFGLEGEKLSIDLVA